MSSNVGYTNGPWTYVANRVMGQGKTVADVRFKNGDNDGPLLAAAPEMYEALRRWMGYWRGAEEALNDGEREMYEATELALSKVEGK